MEFVRLDTGELFVRGHNAMPSTIRTALGEHLESEGVDPWEADNAAPAAMFSRTWYSPTAGFMHDCTGHPSEVSVAGCSDNEPVTVVRVAVR
jgi:hypothetical protein